MLGRRPGHDPRGVEEPQRRDGRDRHQAVRPSHCGARRYSYNLALLVQLYYSRNIDATDTKQYAQVIAVRGGHALLVQFITRAIRCFTVRYFIVRYFIVRCFIVRAAWTRPAPSSALADAEGCGAEVAK